MKYIYRHLELADFIIYSYTGGDQSDYKPMYPDNIIQTFKKLSLFYDVPNHVDIVKEFFD